MSRPSSCEPVGVQLVDEPDPAALVAAQVHDHAAAFAGDPRERRVELGAAVAAERAEEVAGQALGVDADEDVCAPRDVAADERDVLAAADQVAEDVGDERTMPGREARLGDPLDDGLGAPAVGGQVVDVNQGEPVLRARRPRARAGASSCRRRARARRGPRRGRGRPGARGRTAASVWPRRASTPPSRARSGNT